MATSRKRKLEETTVDDENNSIEEPQLKKAKLENDESDKMELETESELVSITLPPEIMISIFEKLSRNDLARASMACQEWKNYSRDPIFSWVFCRQKYPSKYFWGAPKVDSSKYKMVLEETDVTKVTKHVYHGISTTIEHDEYTYQLTFVGADGKELDYKPIIITKDYPLPTSKDDSSLVRFYYHGKDFQLEYEVNIRRLEIQLQRGEIPRWIGMIIADVDADSRSLTNKLFTKTDFKAAFIPVPNPDKVAVKGFAKKLKLHDYQQKAISWMNHIENTADDEVDYVRLVPWNNVATDLLFETELKRVCLARDIPEFTKQMSHKGGILADEMGLGKTVEVIGLILSNPCKELEDVPDTFASKATLVVCPNHLTKQWIDEVNKHTSPNLKVHLITTMAEVKALSYGDLVDADVVVVSTSFLKNPNYFFHEAPNRSTGMGRGCNQDRMNWVDKTFKRVHGKKNWREEKAPLLDLFNWHRLVLDEGHETFSDELLDSIVWRYSSTYSWYVTGTPFPNSKLLERVAIYLGLMGDLPDNNMEHFEMSVKQDYMVNNLLWRNLKANITTQYEVPDLETEEIKLTFTQVESAIYEYLSTTSESYYYNTPRSDEYLRKYCDGLKRAGKYLAEDRKYFITQCKSEISRIDSSMKCDIERKEKYEKNTEAEILAMFEWQRTDRLNFLQNFDATQLKHAERRLKYVKLLELIVNTKSPSQLAEQEDEETNYNNNNADNKVTEDTAVHEQPSTPPLNDETEKENPTNDDQTKAQDDQEEDSTAEKTDVPLRGRGARRRGAQQAAAKKELPPAKKKSAPAAAPKKAPRGGKKQTANKDNAAEQIDQNKVKLYKSKLTAEEELPLLLERRGTKLAHLVIYLRKLFTFQKKSRAIIFSQFSPMLSEIEELLGKCGIECAFVEGSVFKKNKALTSFKAGNSKTKVILLSLEKAASGTNLVEASHIIFMEPMAGSKQEIEAYESQAIGRAHRQGQKNKVTIVRFYTANTIEEDMHNRRKGIMKAPQIRTKSGLLVRTNSLSTKLASSAVQATLKRSGSIANLVAQSNVV